MSLNRFKIEYLELRSLKLSYMYFVKGAIVVDGKLLSLDNISEDLVDNIKEEIFNLWIFSDKARLDVNSNVIVSNITTDEAKKMRDQVFNIKLVDYKVSVLYFFNTIYVKALHLMLKKKG